MENDKSNNKKILSNLIHYENEQHLFLGKHLYHQTIFDEVRFHQNANEEIKPIRFLEQENSFLLYNLLNHCLWNEYIFLLQTPLQSSNVYLTYPSNDVLEVGLMSLYRLKRQAYRKNYNHFLQQPLLGQHVFLSSLFYRTVKRLYKEYYHLLKSPKAPIIAKH